MNKEVLFCVLMLTFMTTIFTIPIGICIGKDQALRQFERNAVKAGAAVWLHDKDTGEPVIRWINTPLSPEVLEGK
jgi:hypothetical protein